MSASTKATKAASSADEFASSAARPRRRGGPLTSEEIEDAERLRLAVETAKNATGLSQEALCGHSGIKWRTRFCNDCVSAHGQPGTLANRQLRA